MAQNATVIERRAMARLHLSALTLLVEFRGRGTPVDTSPGFSISEATGPVELISASEMAAVSSPGAAKMKTRVFTLDGRFWEAGEITFAQLDGSLLVDSPAPGTVHQRPDGTSYGSITWRVLSGTGRLAGAQGLVTGNFTGDSNGGFTDYQVYNLLLSRRE
jgi:hypothetical protein